MPGVSGVHIDSASQHFSLRTGQNRPDGRPKSWKPVRPVVKRAGGAGLSDVRRDIAASKKSRRK